MTKPYLTEEEIEGICFPLTQPAAMIRYLRAEGFFVKPRPDGRPLVSRENFNLVMSGRSKTGSEPTAGEGPNVQALLDRYQHTGAPYASERKTAKEQPARPA